MKNFNDKTILIAATRCVVDKKNEKIININNIYNLDIINDKEKLIKLIEYLSVPRTYFETINYLNNNDINNPEDYIVFCLNKKIITTIDDYDYFEIEYLCSSKKVFYVKTLKDYIFVINYFLDMHYVKKNKVDGEKSHIRNKYIFRGLSNKEQIRSHFYRAHNGEFNVLDKRSISLKEYDYIRKFEQNCSCELGQFNNPIDLAAAAEHYSINTRLIDWSRNPLVSTLFSLFSQKQNSVYSILVKNIESTAILYSLREKTDSSNSMFLRFADMIEGYQELKRHCNNVSEVERNFICNGNKYEIFNKKLSVEGEYVKQYFEDVFSKTNIEYFYDSYNNVSSKNKDLNHIIAFKKFVSTKKIFLETNYSNSRLCRQQGLFEIDDLYEEYDLSRLSAILISKRARNEIIKYVNTLGLNYYLLFDFDIENNCKVTNEIINGKISYNTKIDYK